jgi:long-subunit acyl-CoA synthetase (AMP-forming)
MSNTVLGLLHDAAARHPERAYLKAKADDGWNAVSFSRAETRSDELAAALLSGRHSGRRPGGDSFRG